MRGRALLLMCAIVLPMEHVAAQTGTELGPSPAAASSDMAPLDNGLQAELQALERDLAGPIATVGYAAAPAPTEPASPPPPEGAYMGVLATGFPQSPVPQVNFADGRHWMLRENLMYRPGDSQYAIEVPAGFVHDFASVPNIASVVVPDHGPYNRAAIIHDYLYWGHPCTRLQADNLFLIAMIEAGVVPWRRWMIYRAVRLGGRSPWEDNAAERARRLPRVVPAERWSFPGYMTWPVFRQELFNAGVLDEVSVGNNEFCRLGDSTRVPDSLLMEAAGSL